MQTFSVEYVIAPKAGFRNPQGEQVSATLRRLGFDVENVAIGTVLHMTIDAPSGEEARRICEEACAAAKLFNLFYQGAVTTVTAVVEASPTC